MPDVEAQAAAMRAQFQGAAIRIGDSHVIHAQDLCTWIAGVQVPAPACHTGFAISPDRLHPVWQDPTCQLCTGRRRPAEAGEQITGQLTLDATLEDV
ncbi:hypothetical protein [Streptomonospora litoralis]|uniref:Uncharacterized protein n=1 Tax=Streptomonospora litoralis TaxID=2498135 RepID=A0A4P6Q3Q7_9ACTN|nr:hypothetical protein [Streptomonospora litoralis]QBI53454.1 hypothetical protein EKD16_08300 [Streptomonospora litoralis]